jgi:hypothetical protein
MGYMNTTVGALTIMMASGLIVDFEVTEVDNEVYVRVWSSNDGRARQHLQKQMAAILPPRVEEHHVTVVNGV